MYNNPTMVCCRKDQKQETSRMFQGTQVRESVQKKLTSTTAKTTKQKKKFYGNFLLFCNVLHPLSFLQTQKSN